MSTSTNIAKYPSGMLDVLEAVCETKKPCAITYPDAKKAKGERLRFYGLIRALVINKHSLAEEASRLTIAINEKNKRAVVMTISPPDETPAEDFYSAIAVAHIGPPAAES